MHACMQCVPIGCQVCMRGQGRLYVHSSAWSVTLMAVT